MPHKHTRRAHEQTKNDSNFNLPPTASAKPLPTHPTRKPATKNSTSNTPRPARSNANNATNNNIATLSTTTTTGYKHNDTPRAFTRMLQHTTGQKRMRSGLDDGESSRKSKKKLKREDEGEALPTTKSTDSTPATASETPAPVPTALAKPTILPGERLSTFAARVDASLPLSDLKSTPRVNVINGVKMRDGRQTKKEKKMEKMYAAWRVEDAKRKERAEELKEEEEDAAAEDEGSVTITSSALGDGSKKKRKRGGAGVEEDIWAPLAQNREERRGLHDIVQAPPTFRTLPKEKFKIRAGAKVDVENVPSASGSLKRREELGEARREVIERYRAMMGRASAA